MSENPPMIPVTYATLIELSRVMWKYPAAFMLNKEKLTAATPFNIVAASFRNPANRERKALTQKKEVPKL